MGNFLFYLVAFAVALGILIVVHELGHFIVARWCGVKVLRFSIGFGHPLIIKQFGADRTEWALSVFPLGGYVKMLDGREEEVPEAEAHRAFDKQNVYKRSAIVVAGPLANFLLAIVLYWALFVSGTQELRPLLGQPPAASIAAKAGINAGETVRSINGELIQTWQDLRWQIVRSAAERQVAKLETINQKGEIAIRRLDFSSLEADALEGDAFERFGFLLFRPTLLPILGTITQNGVAAQAGLARGDRIVAVDGMPVPSWAALVETVRNSPGKLLHVDVTRNSDVFSVDIRPAQVEENGKLVGRIGVGVLTEGQNIPEMRIRVKYDVFTALAKAGQQTWETSVFSLKMLGKMVVGEVSWKNLSGPVTIADYAGQSARAGYDYYLKFLALVSISLGVLNLLPIPVLDGGHLLYHMLEMARGRPVSDRFMEVSQQVGLAALLLLMAFAFYNDINRLISG